MTLSSDILSAHIKTWGQALGFDAIAITDTQLENYEPELFRWLQKGFHGGMDYMARYGTRRSRPKTLLPKTKSIIMVCLDYLPPQNNAKAQLKQPDQAYISLYAQGRDYHKIIRKKLQQLAEKIAAHQGAFHYRAFTDSAPVMEKPLAEKAGLGWIGKNTCLINSKAGSWFFLGALFTDLDLLTDEPQINSHCGSCRVCLDVCPTNAIVAPYQLDASLCISYLTIELRGSIPEKLRPLIGNRIYGCDDCQLFCPWNKFAKPDTSGDFHPRHKLNDSDLLTLFAWNEATFLEKTQGSAIRRIGHLMWLRNIAIALGNAPFSVEILKALEAKKNHTSILVREHINWAIKQQHLKRTV